MAAPRRDYYIDLLYFSKRTFIIDEIEKVVKELPFLLSTSSLQGNSTTPLRNRSSQCYFKLFQNIENKGKCPQSFLQREDDIDIETRKRYFS